jgi:hypothetical protein
MPNRVSWWLLRANYTQPQSFLHFLEYCLQTAVHSWVQNIKGAAGFQDPAVRKAQWACSPMRSDHTFRQAEDSRVHEAVEKGPWAQAAVEVYWKYRSSTPPQVY